MKSYVVLDDVLMVTRKKRVDATEVAEVVIPDPETGRRRTYSLDVSPEGREELAKRKAQVERSLRDAYGPLIEIIDKVEAAKARAKDTRPSRRKKSASADDEPVQSRSADDDSTDDLADDTNGDLAGETNEIDRPGRDEQHGDDAVSPAEALPEPQYDAAAGL